MMKCLTVATLLVLCTAPAVAQTGVDAEKEKAELLRMHRADREAHFKTDVDLLQERTPEGLIAVSRGKIHRPTRAEQRQRFAEYFRGARYFEWDDLEEPIIRVSKDGSMAWMITRIRVRRVQKEPSGTEREEKFVYAGIMTYEKQNGKWMRVANVSTFEPPN